MGGVRLTAAQGRSVRDRSVRGRSAQGRSALQPDGMARREPGCVAQQRAPARTAPGRRVRVAFAKPYTGLAVADRAVVTLQGDKFLYLVNG